MYAISDMIDEFEVDTEAFTQPSKRKFSLKKHLAVMFQPCLIIGPRFKLANEMETMRKHLKEITDQQKDFNFSAGTNPSELNVPDERETISSIDVQIFGRNEERDRLLAYLSQISMTEDCPVLAIYGIGGLGKTTLAQMVYNSSQYRDYSRVWVYVSQTFDLMKIGTSIISQLSKEQLPPHTTLQLVQNTVLELVAGKKILIVLDDLWEFKEVYWKKLKAMLHGEGSKVIAIVTTRSEAIAVEVSTNQAHKLALLENEVCWSIIKKKSDFESKPNKEELKDIGMSIARKCGGVALAAQSLGFLLKKMDIHQWRSMMDNDIWSLSDSEDPILTNVLASLMLSYSVMPKDLNLCFAYCAIFPKGLQIVKGDLIDQWISLDFIKPTIVRSCWDTGEEFIRQLLGLSFLQESKSSLEGGVHLEDATLFTMHDLVHDLSRLVMFDEIIIAREDNSNRGSSSRLALLNDCSKPLESPKIRALRFMDCGEIELDGAAFSSAKSLRILDLSECSIRKLPNSVGVLKHLRYLNAPRVQHETIPDSITRLSKLTYLNLHGSFAISALPECIGEIEGLLYLDLSGCSKIEKLPESFGRLTKLVHMDLSNCSRVGDLSMFLGSLVELQYLNLSHCPNIGKLPADLGGLLHLRYLNLAFSSYLQRCLEAEVLGNLTKLKYLNLSSEDCFVEKLPEALGGFSELRYLNISGWQWLQELPIIGNLRELRYLNLSGCTNSVSAGDEWKNTPHCDSFINSISTLLNLEHLDFSNNFGIHIIPGSILNLKKLHTLNLSGCTSLRKVPESIGTMVSLRNLYLEGCPLLGELTRISSSLISLPRFVVLPADGECSSNLVLLQHTDPAELEIAGLENVKTSEEAHRINLMGKKKLVDLKLKWTRHAERLVDDILLLEKLVPPCTLRKFQIQGYNSVSFPSWIMDIAHYLPNLTTVEMCDIPNCNVLPPLSHLPNLDSLVLKELRNVEELNTSCTSGQECKFETLEINRCPRLRFKTLRPRVKNLTICKSDIVLSSCGEYTAASTNYFYPVDTVTLHVELIKLPMHQWRLLQHLPGLTSLEISTCDDLTGSPEIIRHLSSLESLILTDQQQELPKWLGDLPSLQELGIVECHGIKELHQSMRLLTKLHSFKLSKCSSIASLPHWLGELASLNKLEMTICNSIRCFPEGIQQLTNLQKLHIARCRALKNWCDLEEKEMKLTPNQERTCVLPTSLKEIKIDGCDGISYLPEGIQQLTNLQELRIFRCPALKKWCEQQENEVKLAHIKDKLIRDKTGYYYYSGWISDEY